MESQVPVVLVPERELAEMRAFAGDVSGLPPALFAVGAEHPLLDDTLLTARRWEESGNRAER